MRRLLLGLGVVCLTCAMAAAQQPKPFDFHAGAELDRLAAETMAKAKASPKGSAGGTIESYPDHKITIAARVKSGGPEVHEHWTDVMLITGGRATLLIGGTVVKPVPRGPAGSGEMGGSDIRGGTTQVLQKGDLINIPAGTPHWIKIAPGDSFSYLNFKTRH